MDEQTARVVRLRRSVLRTAAVNVVAPVLVVATNAARFDAGALAAVAAAALLLAAVAGGGSWWLGRCPADAAAVRRASRVTLAGLVLGGGLLLAATVAPTLQLLGGHLR